MTNPNEDDPWFIKEPRFSVPDPDSPFYTGTGGATWDDDWLVTPQDVENRRTRDHLLEQIEMLNVAIDALKRDNDQLKIDLEIERNAFSILNESLSDKKEELIEARTIIFGLTERSKKMADDLKDARKELDQRRAGEPFRS